MLAHAVSFAWYRFLNDLPVGALLLHLGDPADGRARRPLHGRRRSGPQHRVFVLRFVASSHVPNLFVLDGVINPGIGLDSAYNPVLLGKLSHLPHVERVADTVQLNVGPLTPKGRPLPASTSIQVTRASTGWISPKILSPSRRDGWPIPTRPTSSSSMQPPRKAFGYHLGEEIPVGWLNNTQANSGNFAPNSVDPRRPTCDG